MMTLFEMFYALPQTTQSYAPGYTSHPALSISFCTMNSPGHFATWPNLPDRVNNNYDYSRLN